MFNDMVGCPGANMGAPLVAFVGGDATKPVVLGFLQ